MHIKDIKPSYEKIRHFLDEYKTAWLDVYIDSILEDNDFSDIYNQKMSKNSHIIHAALDGSEENHNCHREYVSLGVIPNYNGLMERKTYMYGDMSIKDGDNKTKTHNIDKYPIAQSIINHFNGKFNQAIINWYENGENYIPFHSDCERQMNKDHEIAIITFTPSYISDNDIRTLSFKANNRAMDEGNVARKYDTVNIKTVNGSVVIIGGKTNQYFRHGVKQQKTNVPRVSISLRTINEV